jgi:hypothetical protein
MAKGGLLAILAGAKPKGSSSDEDEADDGMDEESEGADVGSLLGDAYDALLDKDRKGFIRSMKAAIEACKEE